MAGSADENGGGASGAGGEFQRAAERAARSRTGPVAEFVYLIRRTRNYWLVPVIVALLLTGFVVVGSSSTLAPLIYALF